MTLGSSSRNDAEVIWIAIHTTEGILSADDLAPFFEREFAQNPNNAGSSHAAIDDTKIIELVPYDRACWALRNGNPYSDNAELCGHAVWSRTQWMNEHDAMLWNAARWIAARVKARPNIPCIKISPADVAANKPGVIGHNDYTIGKKDGSHWDPGNSFPWDIVIDRAQSLLSPMQSKQKDDDMFIKCASYNGKPFVGILSGGVLTGLASDGELRSADACIAAGASCQWVEETTVTEIDRKSKLLIGDTTTAV